MRWRSEARASATDKRGPQGGRCTPAHCTMPHAAGQEGRWVGPPATDVERDGKDDIGGGMDEEGGGGMRALRLHDGARRSL